jgi:hypothetical protein
MEGMDGCPTNLFPGSREGEKEVKAMVELRTIEDLVFEVEHGARKIITQLGPYAVQVYRVKLAGGPVIRIDLKKVGGKKDDR